jgi:hypothetical protein
MAKDQLKALRHDIEKIEKLESIKFTRMLASEEMHVISASWHAVMSTQMTSEAVMEAYGATPNEQAPIKPDD